MPTYDGTDAISQWTAGNPLGTGAPSELDDAIREIKTILTAVLLNSMSDKGAQRMAIFKFMSSTALATPANNVWFRLPLSVTVDPTSLLGVGDWANSVKPIAGIYLVRFYSTAHGTGHFQSRVAQATSSVTNPSASNAVADLVGGVCVGSDARQSGGVGILTTDGTKSYCLDTIVDSSGFVAIAAGTNGLSGAAAVVEFHFVGIVAP